MTKRFPVIASIVAALAVATMIGLGVWQLQRKNHNEELLSKISTNSAKPSISFPELGPVRVEALHRKSSLTCLRIVALREDSGKDSAGKAGTRYLAECATGVEGPGALIAVGVSDRPNLKIDWNGGLVSGIITEEPDRQSLFAKLFGPKIVLRPMLVSRDGLGGLRTPARPSLDKIRDRISSNGLYAIQWFFFAFVAALIYVLALRKRQAGR
jgi:surfeit locus 1 family protein